MHFHTLLKCLCLEISKSPENSLHLRIENNHKLKFMGISLLAKINTGEKTLLPLFIKVRTSRMEFAIKGTI